jgi:hypothetical protein
MLLFDPRLPWSCRRRLAGCQTTQSSSDATGALAMATPQGGSAADG